MDDADPPRCYELFLGAVYAVVMAALERTGEDPEARFAFFRRLLEEAAEAAAETYLS